MKIHEDFKEEIYMEVPPGFSLNPKEKMVCRLRKMLHGLKL